MHVNPLDRTQKDERRGESSRDVCENRIQKFPIRTYTPLTKELWEKNFRFIQMMYNGVCDKRKEKGEGDVRLGRHVANYRKVALSEYYTIYRYVAYITRALVNVIRTGYRPTFSDPNIKLVIFQRSFGSDKISSIVDVNFIAK